MALRSFSRRLSGAYLIAGTALLLRAAAAEKPESSDSAATRRYWPAWRGPLATGVAPEGDPPVEWSEGKNIAWKTAIPGLGHSTPIVWGDRVFLAAAIPIGEALAPIESRAPGAHDNLPVTHRQRWVVLAVAREDGKILWERPLKEALPIEQGHQTASLASSSPVADGERLIVNLGSYGLYALDFGGEVLWKQDLGVMQILHGHGEASSPVLHRDTVVINWDHEGQSFIAAFDKRTGKERWRAPRDEITSWATPIVVEHAGRFQVIASGTRRVRGYDLENGKLIWECGGLSANVVASPVAGEGMVYAGSSYDTKAFLAIRLDGAQGDVTGTDRIAWQRSRGTPYVPSPLLHGETLYFLSHYQGVLTRVHAKSGRDDPGPLRLDGIRNVYASPVAAAGRVYITDLDGLTLVLEHDQPGRILARNRLDESFSASAAIAGGDLFLRGRQYLYCIRSAPPPPAPR